MDKEEPNLSNCPNCCLALHVWPKNCRIIRCGANIVNGIFIQFPPHANRAKIAALMKKPHVGCGSPLILNGEDKLVLTSWRS